MKKTTKFFSLFLASSLSIISLLSGCKQGNPDKPLDSEISVTTESEQIVETKSITISVFNLSNVQIGMFSVIDPATGDQINLDSLEPGNQVSLECNWPSTVEQFQWALYNMNGELCIDASTGITEAKESVNLVLMGEDTIEDVKVLFDTELSVNE